MLLRCWEKGINRDSEKKKKGMRPKKGSIVVATEMQKKKSKNKIKIKK